ncbi:hypothetical protein JOE31_000670 [Arthrobacter sp. PvP023]|uniref:hypothetical protein n=1 Tax=Micrococcaceae TaxID=1268 RepID=UPI001AE90C7B|nr:hypothetical protein [Arthrobacter sp. PvP023]MBP1134438.1 hypothetical protein [Arthrobacter sp. PvP023]
MATSSPAKTLIRDGRPWGAERSDATPSAAVMDRLPDRTVIHRGRVVADGLRLLAGPHGE